MPGSSDDEWVASIGQRAKGKADDRAAEVAAYAGALIPKLLESGLEPDAVCVLFSGPNWDQRDLEQLRAWVITYWEVQWGTLRLYLIENNKVCVLPGASHHATFTVPRSATGNGALRDLPEFFAMQKLRWRFVEDEVAAALRRLAERYGVA